MPSSSRALSPGDTLGRDQRHLEAPADPATPPTIGLHLASSRGTPRQSRATPIHCPCVIILYKAQGGGMCDGDGREKLGEQAQKHGVWWVARCPFVSLACLSVFLALFSTIYLSLGNGQGSSFDPGASGEVDGVGIIIQSFDHCLALVWREKAFFFLLLFVWIYLSGIYTYLPTFFVLRCSSPFCWCGCWCT